MGYLASWALHAEHMSVYSSVFIAKDGETGIYIKSTVDTREPKNLRGSRFLCIRKIAFGRVKYSVSDVTGMSTNVLVASRMFM
jgi:hypothetical protein